MNYKIVKTKLQKCKKYGLIYSTILYDLENSPDITELYAHQKNILHKILTKSNKKLYALVCSFYETGYEKFSEEYKLWKSFIPFEDEEFSPIEHAIFEKPIFEQKVRGSGNLWNGIAEITPNFYTDNYIFFNNQSDRFLLIADEEQVEQIKLSLNAYLAGMADTYKSFNIRRNYFLQILDDTDCILVETRDDAHEGSFMFYVNSKSKYCGLLDSVFQ